MLWIWPPTPSLHTLIWQETRWGSKALHAPGKTPYIFPAHSHHQHSQLQHHCLLQRPSGLIPSYLSSLSNSLYRCMAADHPVYPALIPGTLYSSSPSHPCPTPATSPLCPLKLTKHQQNPTLQHLFWTFLSPPWSKWNHLSSEDTGPPSALMHWGLFSLSRSSYHGAWRWTGWPACSSLPSHF